MNRIWTVALTLLFAVGGAFGARAQQPASLGEQATGTPAWTFNIAPYLWMPSLHTDLNFNLPPALGGTLSTNSSIGFSDLVSHLNFATMVTADAHYGPFSVVTDFIYLNLGGTADRVRAINFPNHPAVPLTSTAQSGGSLNLNSTIWTLAGGYTFAQGDWGNFDAIAGLRFLALNTRTNYSLGLAVTGPRGNGTTFGGNGSVSGSGDIWNGIGGFRGRIRIGKSGLFIPYYFDIGAGGSDLTWQISSGLGYHTSLTDVSLTYRYLSFEQGSGAMVQHLWIQGPLLMASFTF